MTSDQIYYKIGWNHLYFNVSGLVNYNKNYLNASLRTATLKIATKFDLDLEKTFGEEKNLINKNKTYSH